MTFRSIYFDDQDGSRLKSFTTSSSKSGATTTVKIELEIADPFRLSMLLQSLAETKRDQGKPEPTPLRRKPDPTPARKSGQRPRTIGQNAGPLLLTYEVDK